jgi:hypothetical protein
VPKRKKPSSAPRRRFRRRSRPPPSGDHEERHDRVDLGGDDVQAPGRGEDGSDVSISMRLTLGISKVFRIAPARH